MNQVIAGLLTLALALGLGILMARDLLAGWREGEFASRGRAIVRRTDPMEFYAAAFYRLAVVLAMAALGTYGLASALGLAGEAGA